MARDWTPDELERLHHSRELEIAPGEDAAQDRWTPIWVVAAGAGVFVRTWHRRTSGWYGRALRSGRASVRVPGLEAEVSIDDVGAADPDLRKAIDAAYTDAYGGGGTDRMVGDEAAATTLRLTPA